ncbi:polyadenylate-specific 3'-exoribonuclease AS [Corynebacterium uberis]|uniref:polyadenylate-specific 3'-exoribonuclease AS n=1 Tax=Corynebacterium TaxID=1716 RepID=UPI001D0A5643|nr:polyadenylate-specific 3'-exoribonuclease AS [Corynebacterium uberis]MCZ9308290.1 polyadenylate-specific 3'-exoribonuclease AS [Corynebacterium sp. c6VSa_13]UDL73969.1 polyadenylate-specific 3'-exoribonuclease AS [Corynebacterium uberis]UDL75147.1 polyadenylate-specific 3'-exoribonuclease AS [Corynebacterium uberis]UDL77359.1 polyadenylate-specific 3'-exoribonuclease AS [Corynebacterium uberis]UDL79643.1 polyadenylate-specific 3'-exoribonuclease AS [Corynebacterium uberis]
MRFFYDTEFIEDGRTIDLVSVGIVAEDGREYYAVSAEFDADAANTWVRENVLDKLPSPDSPVWKSRRQIREEILSFVTTTADGAPTKPELWAWVGAYDHVVIAQLWGDMAGLPREMPRYTRELKQLWELAGRPRLPRAPEGVHDALVDARHNLRKFQICAQRLGSAAMPHNIAAPEKTSR